MAPRERDAAKREPRPAPPCPALPCPARWSYNQQLASSTAAAGTGLGLTVRHGALGAYGSTTFKALTIM
jgi:hypothetical protein